jgi:hypothetical protein
LEHTPASCSRDDAIAQDSGAPCSAR